MTEPDDKNSKQNQQQNQRIDEAANETALNKRDSTERLRPFGCAVAVYQHCHGIFVDFIMILCYCLKRIGVGDGICSRISRLQIGGFILVKLHPPSTRLRPAKPLKVLAGRIL